MNEASDLQSPGSLALDPFLFPEQVARFPILSDPLLERLFGTTVTNANLAKSKGSVLFAEGQKVHGVYILREGRLKLSLGSDNGKFLILGLMGRGAVFDLPAAILGLPHAATAEVVVSAKLSFLSRNDLLRRLRGSDAAAYAAAEALSAICYSGLTEIRRICLSQSAEQKMACFLLELCPAASPRNRQNSNGHTQVTLDVSQEEIGQMIGTSRETVARIISRFKKRNILGLKNSTLVIHDRAALAKLAESTGEASRDLTHGATSVQREELVAGSVRQVTAKI